MSNYLGANHAIYLDLVHRNSSWGVAHFVDTCFGVDTSVDCPVGVGMRLAGDKLEVLHLHNLVAHMLASPVDSYLVDSLALI